MKPTLALSAFLLSLAIAQEGTSWEFKLLPDLGVSLTRSFSERTEVALLSTKQWLDGVEQDETQFELEIKNTREASMTDLVLETEGGQIARLARSFPSIFAKTLTSGQVGEYVLGPWVGEGSSELVGAEVLLGWNDEEECAVTYSEDFVDYDPVLLKGLTETGSLAGLLPDEKVSMGDKWGVDPEVLVGIIQPGGDLGQRLDQPEKPTNRPAIALSYFFSLAECGSELGGDVELEFQGIKSSEDGDVASFSIVAEFTSTRDVLEAMSKIAEGMGSRVSSEVMGTLEETILDYSFAGVGELLWDVDGGYARFFELSGQLEVLSKATYRKEGVAQEQERTFAGTTRLTVETERD